MTLRSKLIRLAHENPELRPHLLPILQKKAQGPACHAGYKHIQQAESALSHDFEALEKAMLGFLKAIEKEADTFPYPEEIRDMTTQGMKELRYLQQMRKDFKRWTSSDSSGLYGWVNDVLD